VIDDALQPTNTLEMRAGRPDQTARGNLIVLTKRKRHKAGALKFRASALANRTSFVGMDADYADAARTLCHPWSTFSSRENIAAIARQRPRLWQNRFNLGPAGRLSIHHQARISSGGPLESIGAVSAWGTGRDRARGASRLCAEVGDGYHSIPCEGRRPDDVAARTRITRVEYGILRWPHRSSTTTANGLSGQAVPLSSNSAWQALSIAAHGTCKGRWEGGGRNSRVQIITAAAVPLYRHHVRGRSVSSLHQPLLHPRYQPCVLPKLFRFYFVSFMVSTSLASVIAFILKRRRPETREEPTGAPPSAHPGFATASCFPWLFLPSNAHRWPPLQWDKWNARLRFRYANPG